MTVDIDSDQYRRRWMILGVMCLSLVLVVASVSSVTVALPTLVAELEASASELQWIMDSYALVFAGFLLPAGRLVTGSDERARFRQAY